MEPRPLTPSSPESGGPERTLPPLTPESLGGFRPEQAPLGRQEKQESVESREQLTGHGAGDAAAPTLPPPVLPVPATSPVAAPQKIKADPTNDNPLAADDVDVIEKEWVDRAKKIISETKNDPYQQEHEVSKLQADYLEKRFGVQVKLPQG